MTTELIILICRCRYDKSTSLIKEFTETADDSITLYRRHTKQLQQFRRLLSDMLTISPTNSLVDDATDFNAFSQTFSIGSLQ